MKRNDVQNESKSARRNGTKLAALLLSGVMLIGGVVDFTDTKDVTNTFEVGTVETELTEPSWEEPIDITPNQTIAKDPTITNVGETDTADGDEGNAAYVFMTVQVPRATVISAELDGTRAYSGLATNIDLFLYEISSDWVELGDLREYVDEDNDGEYDSVIYTYAYAAATTTANKQLDPAIGYESIVTAAELTALEVGESTTLFEEVTFANVIEDQGLEDISLDIVINSYAIQTDDLTISGNGITEAYAVLDVIYNQLDD